MARYRRTRSSGYTSRRRTSRGRSSCYRRASVRSTGRRTASRGRAQTVRLVVQMAPPQASPVMTPAGLMKKAAVRQARF